MKSASAWTAGVVALTLLTAGCSGESSTTPEPAPPAVPPASDTAPDRVSLLRQGGLDVSSYSGAIDWPAVRAAGAGFAIARATEGMDLADSSFDTYWPAMKEAGLVRGAYHFYVTEDDPEIQAQFFIDNVTLEPGDLAPVVDIEVIGHDTQPGVADRLRTWLEIVEKHYGIRPIIYTSPNFWNENLDDTFGDYPLWEAEYEVEAPTLPRGWQTWTLWQWKGDAEYAGVEKNADLDRANPEVADAQLAAILVAE